MNATRKMLALRRRKDIGKRMRRVGRALLATGGAYAKAAHAARNAMIALGAMGRVLEIASAGIEEQS